MKDPKTSRFNEIDLKSLKTIPMSKLDRKVNKGEFATKFMSGGGIAEFTEGLPNILAAKNLREFSRLFADAAKRKKAIIVMFGGHVIKTGLAPLLIDWMQRGIITALATHGASTIHDTEIAMFGRTSEDVLEGLSDGSFGMSRDTAEFINTTISDPSNQNLGYGEALGLELLNRECEYSEQSLLCQAIVHNIPLTVHVAIGTDIVHQHPTADGAAIGRLSLRDFRIFAKSVGELSEGGIVLNLGSAVIMPEVFLKALSVARNLGFDSHKFYTANFDMINHYRPMQNVLTRPTDTGGKYFNFIGHHEIMIPLFHALVNEYIGE